MMNENSLYLPGLEKNKMLAYVNSCIPEEACGFLAGVGRVIRKVIPVENQTHSTESYKMEPTAQIEAMKWIELQQMDIIGIFHSHPNGPTELSERDIQGHLYPGAAAVLCFPDKIGGWMVKAFKVIDGLSVQITIEE